MTIATEDRRAPDGSPGFGLGRRVTAVRQHPLAIALARGAWILVCAALAFWPTAKVTIAAAEGGDLSGYAIIMPLLGIVTVIGIALRRGDELPIHDRQIDSIVGGITMVFAVSVQWLLLPRYADQFLLLRIDFLALLLFLLGASILMYGLRPAGRFWPAWLLMIVVSPLAFRVISIGFGGHWNDRALAILLVSACGMAIALGRNRRRALISGVSTVLVGGVALAALVLLAPDWPLRLRILTPALVGGAVVGVGMYFRTGYVFARLDQPHGLSATRPIATTAGMWRASAVVLGFAIAVSLIALPGGQVASASSVVQGPASEPRPDGSLVVPAGWTQVEQLDYPWVTRFFGDNASLVRQELISQTPNPDWDLQSRPRTVMVDTITTDQPAMLSVYTEDTLYPMRQTRVSPKLAVDLGHGITGQLYTIVDEKALLTWTKLTFDWHRDGQFQRITAITVDNHLPTADFPSPTPAMASDISNTLNVLFRGNSVMENDQPEYKDLPMLTVFGQELVAAQMAEL